MAISKGQVIGMELKGFDDVERLMKQLPIKMRRKHLRRATNQSIRIVRDEIKKRAPRDTGRLKRNIKSRGRRGKRGYLKASIFIQSGGRTGGGAKGAFRTDKNDAFYWIFLERGTKHIKARGFIRKSVDRKFRPVLRKFVDVVRAGVREEIRLTRGRR